MFIMMRVWCEVKGGEENVPIVVLHNAKGQVIRVMRETHPKWQNPHLRRALWGYEEIVELPDVCVTASQFESLDSIASESADDFHENVMERRFQAMMDGV